MTTSIVLIVTLYIFLICWSAVKWVHAVDENKRWGSSLDGNDYAFIWVITILFMPIVLMVALVRNFIIRTWE